MKFNFKTLSIALAGMAVSLASCSSEEPFNDKNGVDEGVGIGYMAFTISTDQTRAGDSEYGSDATDGANATVGGEIFNDGSANEYAICPNQGANLAVFFNQDGSVFGASYLTPFDNKDDATHQGTHQPDDEGNKYPEHFYTYVTRWNNTNDEKPYSVIVLINVDPDLLQPIYEDLKNKAQAATGYDLADMLAKTAKTEKFGIYRFSGNDYFTMTNSVYYNENGTEQLTISKIDGHVYDTPEEAVKHKVVVYVERVLAKFELNFLSEGKYTALTSNGKGVFITPMTADGKNVAQINYVKEYTGKETNLDFPDYEPVDWLVYICNWGINGVEPENYYYKQVSYGDHFGTGYDWNSPGLHRSYWAQSKNYTTTDGFPTQYRPTTNEKNGNDNTSSNFGIDNPTSKGQTTDKETTLTYYSFDHFTKRATYKYAPERTYGFGVKKGLTGYGPYRFASHYLIQAQLIVDGVDGVDEDRTHEEGVCLANVSDKYAAYNYYFGDVDSYIRYAYHRMVNQFADGREHALTAEKTYQTDGVKAVLYTTDACNEASELAVKDAADYFETIAAEEIHGDGKVMLALKDGKQLWYKNAAGEATELTAEDINVIAFFLAESARHFSEGKMYYAIPVQHNRGKTTVENRVEVKKDKEYNVGDFGTVRNHWYTLTIKNIGSIGTSVDDPDQPIIPDPEENYNIALEIVVLPWHKIENGEVGL